MEITSRYTYNYPISRHFDQLLEWAKQKDLHIEHYYGFQKEGYKIILTGKNIFVVVPTGMGKTEIAKICTTKALYDNKIAVYLVPTVMLLYQKAKEFEDFYKDTAKIIKMHAEVRPSYDELKDSLGKTVIIATYESFRAFLFEIQKRGYFSVQKVFGSVVVDEAHMLGDETRGARLETMLYELQKEHNPQFCFLSGSFERKSARRWARKFKCELLFRTTERNFKGEIIVKNADYQEDNPKSLKLEYEEKTRLVVEKCGAFLNEHKKYIFEPGKMLIFTYSRKAAEDLAYTVQFTLWKSNPEYKNEIFCDFIHAGIDLEDRKEIFDNFMKDDGVRFLFCSPVLEVGVDIKNIQTILITDAEIYTAIELTQMIGRSREKEGHVIFFVKSFAKEDFIRKIIFNDIANKTLEETSQGQTVLPKFFYFKGFKLEKIVSQLTYKDIPNLALEDLFYHQIDLRKWKNYTKFFLCRIEFQENENRLQEIINNLFSLEYVRLSRKKIGLTYIGEAVVESQVNMEIAEQFSNLFHFNPEPSSQKLKNIISQIATKQITLDDPRFQDKYQKNEEYIKGRENEIQNFLINYRWDLKTVKNLDYKTGFYEGDLENYRRICIWLAASLFLFCQAYIIHEFAKKMGEGTKQNYWEIDYDEALKGKERIFNRVRRIYKRFKKDPDKRIQKKPGILRHKENWRNKPPSQLDDKILDELKKSGSRGLSIKELFMNIYGKINFRMIRAHLDSSLAKKVKFTMEYNNFGRPHYRYFLKEFYMGSKGKICKDCHLFKIDIRGWEKGQSKHKCMHDGKRYFPKQLACKHIKEINRRTIQFGGFETYKKMPRCPGCSKINTIKIPPNSYASICNNCKIVVYRDERGMFFAKKGLEIAPYKIITDEKGFLTVKKKNYKWNLIIKKDHKLKVEKDPNFNIFKFYISKTRRRYFIDSVGRIELFGGEISQEAKNLIQENNIEVIEHTEQEIVKSEMQEKLENEMREKIWKRRNEGELVEIGRQMIFAKIISNVIYTKKLTARLISNLETETIKKKYFENLSYLQLDRLLLTYLFLEPFSKKPYKDKNEIIEIMNKLRSAEGNAEILVWLAQKKALSPKYKLINRQTMRYAQTILYYGAKAYDQYNACLNYLYQLLQIEAGKALEKAGFNRFYPGPGIVHFRTKKNEAYREYKNFYNIMTKKNKEFLFDFMDTYRPPFRYYLGEFFKNNEIDEREDIWAGQDEFKRKIYYVSESGKVKLQSLFEKICSINFYYRGKFIPLQEIMVFEAQNLAKFIESDKKIKYFPFCAFETKEDAQWVLQLIQAIDSILGDGKSINYIDLKEYRQEQIVLMETPIIPAPKVFEARINICIVSHVDFDGFKSALNLTFLHQGNDYLSIIPATYTRKQNHINRVLEEKLSGILKYNMRNIIYIADVNFTDARKEILDRLFKWIRSRGLKVEIIWFDHHPKESEAQLKSQQQFFEKNGGNFYYSSKGDTFDIIINYINQNVDKKRFFKKFGNEKLKNFDHWQECINKSEYLDEWYKFFKFVLFKKHKTNLVWFFKEIHKYIEPSVSKDYEAYLKRINNFLKNPERLLYNYEFGITRDNYEFAAFLFKKDFDMDYTDNLIRNLGKDPDKIDLLIYCWDNKVINIRAPRTSRINLHNIFDISRGFRTAVGVLDPMNEYLAVDEWKDKYEKEDIRIRLGYYITFEEFLSRIKISDLKPHKEEFHQEFAATREKITPTDKSYFEGLYSDWGKPRFPTFLEEFDKALEGGFEDCNITAIVSNKNKKKYLMDLISYLMLAAQDERGLGSKKIICLDTMDFPFYQNLLEICKYHKRYGPEHIKNINFIRIFNNDQLNLVVERLPAIIERWYPKLIIINDLVNQIKKDIPIKNIKSRIDTIRQRAKFAEDIFNKLRLIARKMKIVMIFTHLEINKEILEQHGPQLYPGVLDKLGKIFFLEKQPNNYLKISQRYFGRSCEIIIKKDRRTVPILTDFCYPHLLCGAQLLNDEDIMKKYPDLEYYMEGMNIYGVKFLIFKFKEYLSPEQVGKLRNEPMVKRERAFDICLWYNNDFHIYNLEPDNISLNRLKYFGGIIAEDKIVFYRYNFKTFFDSFEEFFVFFLNIDIELNIHSLSQLLNLLEKLTISFSESFLYARYKSLGLKNKGKVRLHPIDKKKVITEVSVFFKPNNYKRREIRARWYNLMLKLVKILNFYVAEDFLSSLILNLKKIELISDFSIIKNEIIKRLDEALFNQ